MNNFRFLCLVSGLFLVAFGSVTLKAMETHNPEFFKPCDITCENGIYSCFNAYDEIKTIEKEFKNFEISAKFSMARWHRAFALSSGKVYSAKNEETPVFEHSIKPKSIHQKMPRVENNYAVRFETEQVDERYFEQFTDRGSIRTNEHINKLEAPLNRLLETREVGDEEFVYISVGGQRTIQGYEFLKEKFQITEVLHFDIDSSVLNYVEEFLSGKVKSSRFLLDLRKKETWENLLSSLQENKNVILDLSNVRQEDVAYEGLEGIYPGHGVDPFIDAIRSKIQTEGPSFKIEFEHSVWTVADFRGGHKEDRSFYRVDFLN